MLKYKKPDKRLLPKTKFFVAMTEKSRIDGKPPKDQ
jgi:hypothetical protein